MGLSKEFSELVKVLSSGKRAVYTPDQLLQVVWEFKQDFVGFKQQDAQECLIFFLTQLSLEQPVGSLPPAMCLRKRPSGCINHALTAAERKGWADNIILQHFMGVTRNRVECKSCGHVSNSDSEVLGVVTLQIPDTPSKRVTASSSSRRSRRSTAMEFTIEDCLDLQYASPEFLSGSNKYRCSNCNQRTDAVKSCVIASLPRHLVLHVNRTKFSRKTFQLFKARNKVHFPLTDLDMSPYIDPSSDSGTCSRS